MSVSSNEDDNDIKIDKDIITNSIKKNSIEIIRYIYNENIVNLMTFEDEDGNSPLILSIIYDRILLAKFFLLINNSTVNTPNKHGFTPIIIAVFNNNYLMVSLLYQYLSSKELSNITDLVIIAIKNENIDLINLLVQNQYEGYLWDNILMHYACSQSSLEIFNLISRLQFKSHHSPNIDSINNIAISPFNSKDEDGEIPLHWCVKNGYLTILELVISNMNKYGISLDIKSNIGITPFHLACLKQDLSMIDMLYNNGVNVNESDSLGNTICHLIAATGDKEWLEFLIRKYNLNYFLKNTYGNTPIMVSILSQRESVINFFLSTIPNINWRNKLGQTCLHAAVFTKNKLIIQSVLKLNPDLNIEDITGLTPYHYAILGGDEIKKIIDEYVENKEKEENEFN